MTSDLAKVIVPFLSRARWFGGKGRPFTVIGVRRIGEVPRGDDGDGPQVPRVGIDLAEVDYGTGEPDLYQLPLAYYTEPVDRLEHAFVGEWDDPDFGHRFVYDALHDREAMGLWLRCFDTASADDPLRAGPLAFHRVEGHGLDLTVHSTLFSGEQSNSSVAFGDDSLMKVFRKVTPGVNPDIEVHDVLTRADSPHIAALFGWLDAVNPKADCGASGDLMQLAMLQQFLRTASDGWDLALASVRDLFAERDLHAHEVGGDFASESERLGVALAEVHAALAASFPTELRDHAAMTALAATMHQRLDDALFVVPQLAPHSPALRRAFDALGALTGGVPAQRVHGDLHLGQTLRTVKGWKIVDFEGEPAKPLADRLLPDSPWRDVAGMLRSFDYAAHAVERDLGERAADGAEQLAYRAGQWADRNRAAFVRAYVATVAGLDAPPLDTAQATLLRAYEADKAVYEAVYEARNRPSWISIPLAAIQRLGQEDA